MLSQDENIPALDIVPNSLIDIELFRTVREQLLFMAQNTRPGISYKVSQLCQVKC